MSTANRLSALAHLVGKTEEDVLKEKDHQKMLEEIREKNRLQKLKMQNAGQRQLADNLNKANQKNREKLKIKDSEIESLRKRIGELGQKIKERDLALTKLNARSHRVHEENNFIEKRIVAVYGNKALLDLLNHIENPDQARLQDFEKFKQRIMSIKPHF